MSTLTHLESSDQTAATAPRKRMISGPLAVVFVSEFAMLTSFYLLLSVTPLYAARAGAGSAGAGLVTGALLLGTVAAELVSAGLMKRCRYRTLLAGGPVAVIGAVSVVRGFGFGLGTVVMGALTAMLLPPERRGEGLGLYGVVASLPGVLALPAGAGPPPVSHHGSVPAPGRCCPEEVAGQGDDGDGRCG